MITVLALLYILIGLRLSFIVDPISLPARLVFILLWAGMIPVAFMVHRGK